MSEITGRNVGKTCRTHYKGTFNDGTQFDSSYDRGEPLEFVCGAGQMIKGFDAAVADMEVGEMKEIHLMPEEAYGMPDPNAILELEIAKLPGSEELQVGQQVYLTNQMGQPFPVKFPDQNHIEDFLCAVLYHPLEIRAVIRLGRVGTVDVGADHGDTVLGSRSDEKDA